MNQALVIDCTKQTECALFIDGRYTQTTSQEQNKQQEDIMCNMIEELLSQNNTSINKIDTVVVCVGPGSFTGIRKAISYCCGITFFGDAKIIGINALSAMQHKIYENYENSVAKADKMLDKTLSIAILPCNGTMLYFSICIVCNGVPNYKTAQEGTAAPEDIFAIIRSTIFEIDEGSAGVRGVGVRGGVSNISDVSHISHIDIALCDTVPNLLKHEIQEQADRFENEPTEGVANSYSIEVLAVNAQLMGEYAMYLNNLNNNALVDGAGLSEELKTDEVSTENREYDIEGDRDNNEVLDGCSIELNSLTDEERLKIIIPHYIKPPSITQKPKIPQ